MLLGFVSGSALEPRAQRDEAERVAALDALVLLGSPAEPRFDRLTRVTQRHFRVSIALVGLVGADRVWFKSKQGTGVCHIPRDTSFCERVIQSEGVFCVQNALEDPEFSGHPFVSGPSNIRFYAGVPLHAPGGQRIGTLGILPGASGGFRGQLPGTVHKYRPHLLVIPSDLAIRADRRESQKWVYCPRKYKGLPGTVHKYRLLPAGGFRGQYTNIAFSQRLPLCVT
jgi:hypothetical protein